MFFIVFKPKNVNVYTLKNVKYSSEMQYFRQKWTTFNILFRNQHFFLKQSEKLYFCHIKRPFL